jgi:CheY-like chemotaxis protein
MEGKGINILVADDNTINQRVVELTLKGTGFQLQFANNGEEAVQQCQKTRFDLIFMDIHMPVMNGLEACKTIQTLEGYEDVPVVAMSGSGFESQKRECFEAGMVDFMIKPFVKQDLFQTIDKWLAADIDK